MTTTSDQVRILNAMTHGCYDLQQLRIQAGLRLVGNFRAKLKDQTEPSEEAIEEGELSKEAKDLVKQLKESHHRLTDGVARNRTLPAARGFKGDEIISSFAELALVDEYFKLESEEARQFRLLEGVLEEIPIYATYLKDVRGIGPAMAAVIISRLDPAKAHHVSSFWKFAGLDVAPDGRGRSRQKEHLVERVYTDKNGQEKTRMSVTFDPWLKTKLVGVLAGSFLRSGSPHWVQVYADYKHRVESDPSKRKVTSAEWKKHYKETGENLWSPKRVHNAASRYMIKMFLADLWAKWRALEGLPVTPTYHEGVLGHVHGSGQPDTPRLEAAE